MRRSWLYRAEFDGMVHQPLLNGKRKEFPPTVCLNALYREEAGVTEGFLFRTVRKGGRLGPADQPLSQDVIYTLVRQSGAAIRRRN
jgi:hypothetical protein